MQVVLLAGGLGTRLSEETATRPKPMVEIGGQPILWHIMMLYSAVGFSDFVICLGYKGYVIKEYFANFVLHRSDVTVDLGTGQMTYSKSAQVPPWRVSLIDTGDHTMTGGRLKRLKGILAPNEPFCMTYGDGVANIDIAALVRFHKAHGLDATLTAVKPSGRYGSTVINGSRVERFTEKPAGDGAYVNGGFFVLQVTYLVSAAYAPKQERGVRYSDPRFAIAWPITPTVISPKDAEWSDYDADLHGTAELAGFFARERS